MPNDKNDKPAKPKKSASKKLAKPAPKKSLIEDAPDVEIELTEDDFLDDEFEHEHQFVHYNKVHFAAMCEILHALNLAYMPDDDDEPGERFFASWHACLIIAGWSEPDFWECYEGEDPCPICGMDQAEFEEDEVLMLPSKPDPKKMAN